MALTPKQQRFVEEYIIDLNATQAAIRAGYSERTAESAASRLLRNVKVATAVAEAKAARSARTQITQDRVLEELARIGFSDALRHYVMGDDGRLCLADDAPEGASAAVSSVKRKVRTYTDADGNEETTTEVDFKLWDKNTALANLGKHLGLFVDRVDVTSGDAPIRFTLSIEERDGEDG